MSSPNNISAICDCLEILIKEIKSEDSSQTKNYGTDRHPMHKEFLKNVHSTYQKIQSLPCIERLVKQYISLCSIDSCKKCDHYEFLILCLVLLKLLKDYLNDAAQQSFTEGQNQCSSQLLKISQQKTVRKSFQFAVALGILPNLIPGIGIPLSKRLQSSQILEFFTSADKPYQRHTQIVACVKILLECISCDALQGILLSYHSTDMLAALLQLCYAPIKKIQVSSECCKMEDIDFKYLIASHRDDHHNDLEIVKLMHSHRTYFLVQLELFLKKISSSLLLWELLIFQGIPMKSEEFDIQIAKTPTWLRKVCNQLFTSRILENNIIPSLIQVILDKSYDGSIEIGKIDNSKLETIAYLIAYNPVQHISVSEYIQEISKQIFQMLHSPQSEIQFILKHIASNCILQFYERDSKSAEKYFLDKILYPLWCCFQESEPQGDIVANEQVLTTCIEDLHQIFVTCSSPLSRKYIKVLYPFSVCLCSMHFFVQNGNSFLKSKLKDLVTVIFKWADSENALPLLKLLTFPGHKSNEIYAVRVNILNGDEGGIIATRNSYNEFSPECLPYKPILNILNDLKNKNLNRAYILYILKEYHSFHLQLDSDKEEPERIKLGFLFSVILEELSEWQIDMGEILLSNISEVISLLITMLKSLQEVPNSSSIFEEMAKVAVFILSAVLDNEEQLTSKDWTFLKSILPNIQHLAKSQISAEMKEVLFFLSVQISTHGVAGKENIDILKELESLSFQKQNDENSSVDLSTAQITEKEVPSQCETMNSIEKLSKDEKSLKTGSSKPSANRKNCTSFGRALEDILNPSISVKGHGLMALGKLIKSRDNETLSDKNCILKILQDNLQHEDSYVYLPSIRSLSFLADIDPELVLPVILSSYLEGKESPEILLKLGEVLKQICNILGEFIFKYKDQLLHACLVGAKHEDAQIRSSSLSNLGEVCTHLKFDIHTHLQEILSCVLTSLKTDKDLEVRRCCAMVIYLLLKGMGNSMLNILGNDIQLIYRQLSNIYKVEDDEKLRLQAQLALEEINVIMSDLLNPTISLTKEIRILP